MRYVYTIPCLSSSSEESISIGAGTPQLTRYYLSEVAPAIIENLVAWNSYHYLTYLVVTLCGPIALREVPQHDRKSFGVGCSTSSV